MFACIVRFQNKWKLDDHKIELIHFKLHIHAHGVRKKGSNMKEKHFSLLSCFTEQEIHVIGLSYPVSYHASDP